MLLLYWSTTWNVGTYWCEVIFSWFIDLAKKVMNTPWPFEVSLKKEGKRANIAKDVKKWLAFVYLEVFLAVTTSTAQTAVLLNTEGDILSNLNNFLVPRVGIWLKKKKLKNSIAAPSCPPEADGYEGMSDLVWSFSSVISNEIFFQW